MLPPVRVVPYRRAKKNDFFVLSSGCANRPEAARRQRRACVHLGDVAGGDVEPLGSVKLLALLAELESIKAAKRAWVTTALSILQEQATTEAWEAAKGGHGDHCVWLSGH